LVRCVWDKPRGMDAKKGKDRATWNSQYPEKAAQDLHKDRTNRGALLCTERMIFTEGEVWWRKRRFWEAVVEMPLPAPMSWLIILQWNCMSAPQPTHQSRRRLKIECLNSKQD